MRFFFALALALALASAAHAAAPLVHTQTCDASAGVALSADLHAIASDEDNVLRVYRRATGGAPVARIDLSRFLDATEECDLEGATTIGDRVYWISSHGRNKKGKPRPARHRLFATDRVVKDGKTTLVPVGTPYRGLVGALLAAPQLSPLKLSDAEPLAPEAPGGLNIEGLAATPDGHLLIGFRNPVRAGRALAIELENPDAVATRGAAPVFGAVAQLALGGRGIRSIEYVPARRAYLVAAGPAADDGTFTLYRWSGRAADAPVALGASLGTLRPEGLFLTPDGGAVLVSDDGGVSVHGTECKDLADPGARSFRTIGIEP